jgi:hypothetical protein
VAAQSQVNDQVSDAVAEANTTVLGNAPAGSQGLLDTVMAETIGMLLHNAVTAQHNAQMVSSAAVTAACARILRSGGGAAPSPVVKVSSPTPPNKPADDDASKIAQTGRDAKQALAALLGEAQVAARNAADAQDHLRSLAGQATHALVPWSSASNPGGRFSGN